MPTKRVKLLSLVAAVGLLAAGIKLGVAQGQPTETTAPVVYVSDNQVSVYYAAEKKFYVYTELGGNCVYAYTLSTPGGALLRENCR